MMTLAAWAAHVLDGQAGTCPAHPYGIGDHAAMMITTVVMTENGPSLPVPEGALAALRLRTGQRVRVDIQALPWDPLARTTPLVEPDGSPVER